MRPSSKRREEGPTLCVEHARQIVRDGAAPTGTCDPEATWIAGTGEWKTCDVVLRSPKIALFLSDRWGLALQETNTQ